MTGAILVSLTACATASKIKTVEVPKPVYPPDELLQNCPIPQSELITNEDLAKWSKAMKDRLKECNVDKEALRAWRDQWRKNETVD